MKELVKKNFANGHFYSRFWRYFRISGRERKIGEVVV